MSENHRIYHEITVSQIYRDVNTNINSSSEFFSEAEIEYSNIDKYQLLKPIGSGKYSIVFLGKTENGTKCAIKILKPIPILKIKREITILKMLQGVPNVVKLYDVVRDQQSKTISLITEYENFVNPKDLYQALTLTEIRHLMYNLLLSLDMIHKNGIMHRDIKPNNIVIRKDRKNLIIIDWGLADIYIPKQQYSTRVSTLRYKAPELLLDYEYYDYGVDIWGAGCVFGEMLLKYPFFEGRNIDEMIADVSTLCGIDPIVNFVERYGLSVPTTSISLFPQNPGSSWNRVFEFTRTSKRDDHGFDLLKKLLTVDHAKRITANEALKHPFFDSIRNEYQ